MEDISQIFTGLERGDVEAADQLLPLVYRELRDLAARRLMQEPPGQTLEPTALVHEAYLRLVGGDRPTRWQGRRHFFAAAAEAMRRILVENARHKNRIKHGGGQRRVQLEDGALAIESPTEDILALDQALEQLRLVDDQAAEFVELRYFSGLTTEQAAELLGVSVRTGYRTWSFARAWLYRQLHKGDLPQVP
jgi:RNA polymerase sigma factor (TIGR02999 family)